jgi:membrane protein implicated in regulation of membrane protease activity
MWGIWLIIGCILFIVEITTASFFMIFFSIAAFLTVGISLFVDNIAVQIMIFCVLSTIGLLKGRSVLERYFKVNQEVKLSNVDALINKVGVVTKKIQPHEYGLVKIEGDIWTAKSKLEETIEEGQMVIVRDIEGVKLSVELFKEY